MRRKTGIESLHGMAGKFTSPAQNLSRPAQPLSHPGPKNAARRAKRRNHWAASGAFHRIGGAAIEPYLHLSHRLTFQPACNGGARLAEVSP